MNEEDKSIPDGSDFELEDQVKTMCKVIMKTKWLIKYMIK